MHYSTHQAFCAEQRQKGMSIKLGRDAWLNKPTWKVVGPFGGRAAGEKGPE